MQRPLPEHLSGSQALGLAPGQPVAQFELGDFRNFVYLILDWRTRKAAWVDPQRDLEPPLEALRSNSFALELILLTHTHHDHVAGVPGLRERFPQVPIAVHADDRHRVASLLQDADVKELRDGERLALGALEIEVMHTPGHSAGELCYLVHGEQPYLLTGDTVFIRDCGRTDLPTGSTEQMFHSLQRIKRLPLETILLPGHHYTTELASRLGVELETSAPFRCQTIEELGALP
jgi:glyoxylase-like metal-dependent hydrolase (beta-lactamase superfamily II)